MKLTVELAPGESPADADDLLLKALTTKQQYKEDSSERYHDPALNEFHDLVSTSHQKVLDRIQADLLNQIKFSLKTAKSK